MNYKYENIDRIIIAAENEIKNKTLVRVELVQTLIRSLKNINNCEFDATVDKKDDQILINYD